MAQFLVLEMKIKISSLPIQFTGLLEGGDETMPGKRSYKCLLSSDTSTRELREVSQLVRSLSPNTAGPVFLSTPGQGYLVAVFETADRDVVHSTQTRKNEGGYFTSDGHGFLLQLRKVIGK